MATCSMDIKIGVDGSENKELYKSIDITVEMHQEKLNKISQQFTSILGKTVIPFIVIQLPEAGLQNIQIFNFKAHDYDSVYMTANNKLYQYCNPRNKDTIKLLKNIQKQFQKIVKLDNTCNLKLSLYDPLRQQQKHGLHLLNHSKIKGNIQCDQDLVANLTEIIRRISNQFLNSPFMAFIELLQGLSVKLNLSAVEEFPQDIRLSYLQFLNFKEWINMEKNSQLNKVKGDIIIHITLPKLFSIKIKGQAAVFATLFSTFL